MRKLVGFLVLAGGILFLPAHAFAQVVVAAEPDLLEVSVGETFEMNYWIGGLGGGVAPSLGSFDLRMDFDPSLVSYNSVTVGDMLGDIGTGEATTTNLLVVGGINVTEISLLTPAQLHALQPNSFILFTASFTAQAVGDAVFSPMVTELLSTNGEPLPLELGALATVYIRQAPAVPTLSAWGACGLIVSLLLAGLLIVRRR